ncbi:hypothetical protein [Hydrogenophaga sp.]|uniref:hypothetical protein n=1 Tax=Hydrogenophaga sp. TaxID=1904254 RepID=UPI00273521ED|nr:hypothetical protein [Hydrogenophaga sp.]MDP3106963.1 hypothetical protein [Hydrogenophaga sp.]
MKSEDIATAAGAGLVVIIIAVVAITAAFGPDAVSGMFGQTGASWAQAVGTVGAVVGAFWIARREQNERKQKAERIFEYFFSMVQRGISRAHFGAISRTHEITQEAEATLRDAYSFGCSIDLGDLDPQKSLQVARLRTELSELLARLESVATAQGAVIEGHSFNMLQSKLEQVATRCDLTL